MAEYVSEFNGVLGSLKDLPSGNPGKAPEIGGESGRKGGSSTQRYSNFADGMSPEDATRYITYK